MGGVDLADQMQGLYKLDLRSTKWRKKVFYKLMMMAAVNSWIISQSLIQEFTATIITKKKKSPCKSFLVDLAEVL